MGERISYGPSFVPGESGIRLIQFSVADKKAFKSLETPCTSEASDESQVGMDGDLPGLMAERQPKKETILRVADNRPEPANLTCVEPE